MVLSVHSSGVACVCLWPGVMFIAHQGENARVLLTVIACDKQREGGSRWPCGAV
jgi:hypothetical protein